MPSESRFAHHRRVTRLTADQRPDDPAEVEAEKNLEKIAIRFRWPGSTQKPKHVINKGQMKTAGIRLSPFALFYSLLHKHC